MSGSAGGNDAFRIGIDLGGTKLEAVLLELPAGRPLADPSLSPDTLVRARLHLPTPAQDGYDAVVRTLVEVIRSLLARIPDGLREQVAIGVGLPGHVSRRTGQVKNANTTCLNGQDLWGDVRRALERPIAFDNDANCLTLAEATWGAAAGAELVFGVILGTGVGGGVSFRGEVWSGAQGIAGEWGHNVLEPGGRECYCGKLGCVETYLSGPGLERSVRERTGTQQSARTLGTRWAQGTLTAEERVVLEAYLERFGRALSGIVNVLDPEVVVIGGGVSRIEALYTAGRAAVARNVFNDELLTRIVPASLGAAAGVYGAALLGTASNI